MLRWPGAEAHFIAIPSLGLIYGRVPKVANSTIKRLLAHAAGLEDRFPTKGFSKDRNWRGLAPDAEFLTAKQARRRTDLLCFAFVREPLSRLASCYRSKIEQPRKFGVGMAREGLTPETSFPDFVAHVCARADRDCNIHYRPQTAILSDRGGLVPAFIGRFETMAEDWARLSAALKARGAPGLPPLPPRGADRPLSEAPARFAGDKDLIAQARARYAADYEMFYNDAPEGRETERAEP